MQLEVSELRAFYATPLGRLVRRQIGLAVRRHWPRGEDVSIFGHGYATPYLGQFRGEARALGALMPVSQGALAWPRSRRRCSVLVEDVQWPLPDNSVDRLLAIHSVEAAEQVRPLLREMWRVLAPNGRVLIAVPNRRGLWSRFDTTPFGQGRPYSRGQIHDLLAEALFTPLACSEALYLPPIDREFLLRAAPTVERVGRKMRLGVGGVILIEASKDVLAPVGKTQRVPVLREAPA